MIGNGTERWVSLVDDRVSRPDCLGEPQPGSNVCALVVWRWSHLCASDALARVDFPACGAEQNVSVSPWGGEDIMAPQNTISRRRLPTLPQVHWHWRG